MLGSGIGYVFILCDDYVFIVFCLECVVERWVYDFVVFEEGFCSWVNKVGFFFCVDVVDLYGL